MPNIAAHIENNQFYHLFQPMCRLPDQGRFGYEALIRSTRPISPDKLFQSAISQNRLYLLDTVSIRRAVSGFFAAQAAQDENTLLFVNIFPSTIVADDFPTFVHDISGRYPACISRTAFEINESIAEGAIWHTLEFGERIQFLRDKGFFIAMDDVGEGMTSLGNLVRLSPDFVKLDRFFSNGLSSCRKKQTIIRLMVDYCADADSVLILEGIEQAADLDCAVQLGVTVGQGYHLGKPGPLACADTGEEVE